MRAYTEVILPLPLQDAFTYALPPEMIESARLGSRVIVSFGKKKYYTGIIRSFTDTPPGNFEIKEISLLLDGGEPVVKRPQVQLWEWIAEYYLCGVGEVMKAALPAGLKIESETFVELVPDYLESATAPLNDRETYIVQALDHAASRLTVADIEKMTGLRGVAATLGPLLMKGAVIISEKLIERYVPKRLRCVRLTCDRGDSECLRRMFATVKGAPRREQALMALIELGGYNRPNAAGKKYDDIAVDTLRERSGVSAAIVKALADAGIAEIYHKEINRFKYNGLPTSPLPQLTPAQSEALNAIHASWTDHNVTLLHGVTSSGKTEIYLHLADFVMRQGRQVLLLVPEIALTTQLTARVQQVFGGRVIVYHSKFSDNERVDIWRRLLKEKEPCVVIGVRSSVFLPYENLGLVIVDEEHDSSYKQSEPAPRYNGRDAAIVLAGMHGGKVLLGSATPAVDTYYKAQSGKYGLVSLVERYGEALMPRIEIVDMVRERHKGQVNGALAEHTAGIISRAIADKTGQAIVFINRRGFAPVAVCGSCGHTPRCEKCDVALTYHKSIDALVCHYCGTRYPMQITCPACHEPALRVEGYGTERVEEEIGRRWPDVPAARMDLDTTRSKAGHAQIIDSFSSGKSRLLVGTQMVTKGLDFGDVRAVAVINSDALLNSPDFRGSERAFNTISQVAGRAGRRREGNEPAIVAVQTRCPSNPVFPFVAAHDYKGFYDYEIEQRREFSYPPFARVINIYIKHRDNALAGSIADAYARRLQALFGNRVLGPEIPVVSRIQNLYIRKLMLKIETGASMKKVRDLLRSTYLLFHETTLPGIRSATVYYDVDPA